MRKLRVLTAGVAVLALLGSAADRVEAREARPGPEGKAAAGAKPKTKTLKRRSRLKRRSKRMRKPRVKRKKEARKHFILAKRAYYLRRFDVAARHFSKAYEFLPLPEFLLNLGQCHRMLGNYERAIFFYRMYLDTSAVVRGRSQIEKIIVDCKLKLKELELKKKEEERKRKEAKRLKKEAERKRAEAERKRRREREAAARRAAEARRLRGPVPMLAIPKAFVPKAGSRFVPGTEPKKRRKAAPIYKRWWFWTSIAAGVVAATVTGLAVGLSYKTVLPSGSLGTLDAR